MQAKDSNQQLVQKAKVNINMNIISGIKQEKKRSQSTRSRSRNQLAIDFNQQHPSILNQTTDGLKIKDVQQRQLNESSTNKIIIISSKQLCKQENGFCGIEKSHMNQQSSFDQGFDMQKYFSQQSNDDNDLPLPFFPNPQLCQNPYDEYNMNDQFQTFNIQNQLMSAQETPKFNIISFNNHGYSIPNQDELDQVEEDTKNQNLINFLEESPSQLNQKEQINSRRNEFFSFGKARSSISYKSSISTKSQFSQKNYQIQNENIAQVSNEDDDELFENQDFSNIIINNNNEQNFKNIMTNNHNLQNIVINHPNLSTKNKLTSKSPTQFLLSEISQNILNNNDYLGNQNALQNNKLVNTSKFQKQGKTLLPFKSKNIPKGSNLRVLKMSNQQKMNQQTMNGYTFYNYIDKENCQFALPKSDSIQLKNSNKTPIQASHSIQFPSQSYSVQFPSQQPNTIQLPFQTQQKMSKLQLIPPSPTLLQTQQKSEGSQNLRPLIKQKQTKSHSVHQKPLQNLNDSFNRISAKSYSNQMTQNQSFDNIQHSLMQPNSNSHHRLQQNSKSINLLNAINTLPLSNHNSSFEIGRLTEPYNQRENNLKIVNKQLLIINKPQRQFSAKKPNKQTSNSSIHQRMKTIM